MAELGYFDYLKAAFGYRPVVAGMGRLPLNQLGLASVAVLGLLNPGFLFLGAAAEIGYLLWLSTNDRFQKMVQGERLLADKESYSERVSAAIARLSPESQKRYHQLLAECRRIVGISETLEDEGSLERIRSLRGSGLNQLLWIFLRLLTSREVLDDSLGRVDRGKIQAEITKLEQRAAAAAGDEALVRSLNGTLEIRRRRLENLEKAARSLRVVNAELERIEQQVVLVREEAAVGGKAQILSDRLDSVTSALTETNSWMEQNAAIFGELGADPLGSAPADLPEIHTEMESEG